MRWLLISATLVATLGLTGPRPSAAPEVIVVAPPEVDVDSLTASVRLREGLRILERYETFRIFTDQRGVVVETEPEPADSIRLDALGWDNGLGMQSWIFELPQVPEP